MRQIISEEYRVTALRRDDNRNTIQVEATKTGFAQERSIEFEVGPDEFDNVRIGMLVAQTIRIGD